MKRILFSLLLITMLQALTKAQCPGNCTLYTVSNITYSPAANAGTSLVLGDDQVSAAIPIGFTFSFMCNTYTQLYIVSNGFISFDPAVFSGCCSGQFCPTAGGNPDNYVALFWNDLYPPGAGTIKYQTIGTAPNRIFVVTYSLIPFCCGAGPPNNSGQIKLFETSNNIEVHNISVGNQGSSQTQGIMNQSGTAGYAVAGRNAAAWTATADAYKFTPSAAQPSCTGAPVAGTAVVASPTTGCGTLTVNLSLSGTSGTCGALYQWQVAPAPGGPWTNIAGATSSVAATTATVTSYYHCVLTCAGQNATSTAAQVLIPTCTGAPGAGSSQATPTLGCGTVTTNLSLTGTTGTCGATYQWQVATAVGGPYTNIAGATNMTAVATATATRYFRCLLSCAGLTSTSSVVQVSVTAPPCPVGTGVWYINSNVGQPWGTNTNWTSLNTVFSNTWTQGFFETVNLASAFNSTVCLVFLEGGDNNALAMNTFVTNNITTIQNWVSNGGHLYINAAPNQGGNMNWGFGGLTLLYSNFSTTGNASIPSHPIFSGPYAPCTTSYTGNYWSHATVSGAGVSQIMLGQLGNTMGEFNYGAGRVMAGGMTTPNWHSPSPDAQNFLSNTLNYMYGCTVVPLPVELTDFTLDYNGDVSRLAWTTDSEKNTDYFLVEKSSDGKSYSYFDKVIAAGNSTEPKSYSVNDPNPNKTGNTYYRLKQFDKHSNAPTFSQVKVLSLYGDRSKLRVQPNPANNNLEIMLPANFISNFNIQVFDRLGAKVMSTQGAYNSKEPLNLNIENLQNGFYIIHVFDNAGNSSKTTFIKN
jgi:hypothetical protein